MVMSQNTADSSSACILLPEQSNMLLASSLSSPKLNIPMTYVKVQGHFSASLHSFNSWSLPSASLASLACSFANVSHYSGSDWSNSAVCDSGRDMPQKNGVINKIFFSMLPLVFVHFVIYFIFRSRVKMQTDLPFLCFTSLLSPTVHLACELQGIFISASLQVKIVENLNHSESV